MGLLQNGEWVDQWYDTKSSGGKFERQASQFRDTISLDASAKFKPTSQRYHLYVSLACPWAHRALIYRKLKGLEAHIDVSVVAPDMLENGWEFADFPDATGDKLFGFDYMHQVYTKADPKITTRVTVPVLWDKETETIVNNESAEIIRIFNTAFDELTGNTHNYYPEELQAQIDEVNDRVYHNVNNGVYKSGFATNQMAYEDAVIPLFETLDWLDHRLSQQRYLVGDKITEADWRLFTTLVRFDAVYVGHFKCNIRRIADYPNLSGYLRELYQYPGIKETVNFVHIKRHYYFSHGHINPTQVIPAGPVLDLEKPHGRKEMEYSI